MTDRRLQQLIADLGYTPEAGFVPADSISNLPNNRFALRQARTALGLAGVFGLWAPPRLRERFTPLVYLAMASDREKVRELHKWVWSQGLVPFLLVSTEEEIWACKGFSFQHSSWPGRHARHFSWQELDTWAVPGRPRLDQYTAEKLRTSLAWNGFAVDSRERVDTRLLDNLQKLSDTFIRGRKGLPKLPPRLTNALIGRFLYLFFLIDRRTLSTENKRFEAALRLLREPSRRWPLDEMWKLFDDLDHVFNGSIFPITAADRGRVKDVHVEMLRQVLRQNAVPTDGGLQLSFLDFDFSALRTETLSAVYELFLENQGREERQRSGAFYTPPFLVDYVLDRLEEDAPLTHRQQVFDGAAGSGVFLVGAFRRIIERTLADGKDVSIPELREILRQSIFGIERNGDACQVAAFSLYLTLLDYVEPGPIEISGARAARLFPSLVGSNILVRDFFDPSPLPPAFPRRFDCIVGNPPWQTLADLESQHAVDYAARHDEEMPIDKQRASELFAWKSAQEHLKPDGFMGLLLSTKCFVSPSAKRFPASFSQALSIQGVANFSHFRRKLFRGAEHPAVAVFVKNSKPRTQDTFWAYSPLLVSQPMDAQGWPWTVVVDQSDVETLPYRRLVEDERGWFESLMLSPLDRRVAEYLRDLCDLKKALRLQELCQVAGLDFKRGGTPDQTGVDAEYLLESSERRGVSGLGFLAGAEERYQIPEHQMERIKPAYQWLFGGQVLLIPRRFSPPVLIPYPLAFNSSFMGIAFQRNMDQLTEHHLDFLRALEKYLRSRFVTYLAALIGRLWFLDGRRLEPNEIKELPVPFMGLHDERIPAILQQDGPGLEVLLADLFGLRGEFSQAVEEYGAFRIGFQNGKVPKAADRSPTEDDITQYREALASRLKSFVQPSSGFEVRVWSHEERGLAVVGAAFRESQKNGQSRLDEEAFGPGAIQRYDASAGNVFSDSLFLDKNPGQGLVTLVKPWRRFHWTVERAYFDGNEVFRALMRPAASPHAH